MVSLYNDETVVYVPDGKMVKMRLIQNFLVRIVLHDLSIIVTAKFESVGEI